MLHNESSVVATDASWRANHLPLGITNHNHNTSANANTATTRNVADVVDLLQKLLRPGLTSLTNRWTESRGHLRDGWARDWTRKKEMDKKGSLMRSQCHTTVSTVHHHRQASAIFLMCHNYFAIIWLAFSQHQRGPKTGSAVSTAIISWMRRKEMEFQVLPSRHSFHSSTVGN